jgi:hypothetical protein
MNGADMAGDNGPLNPLVGPDVRTVNGLLTALHRAQAQRDAYLQQLASMWRHDPRVRGHLLTVYTLLTALDSLVEAVELFRYVPPASYPATVNPPEVMFGYGGYQDLNRDDARPALDIFSGREMHPESGDQGVALSWWPASPVYLENAGILELDCPPQYLMIEDAANPSSLQTSAQYPGAAHPAQAAGRAAQTVKDIIGYAESFALARFQAQNVWAGYRNAAPAMRASGISVRATKKALGSKPRLARQTAGLYDALADRVAGVLADRITALADVASAKLTQIGIAMPAAIGTPTVIASVAQTISDAVRQGIGARVSLGSDSEVAFSWALGLPRTLVSYVNSAPSSNRHVDVTVATDSGEPVSPIGEGAPKPAGVLLTSSEVDMAKYAGYAELTTEQAGFVTNVENAVTHVLVSRVLRGIQDDIVAAALDPASGVITVAAANAVGAVIAGQAAVLGNGGVPSVVCLSADDYVAIMTPAAGVGVTWSWPDMAPLVVPGLAAGTVVVLDGNAVTVLEALGGPLVIVDPYSNARNNKITIVLDEFTVPSLTAPGGIAVATIGAGATKAK